MPTDEPAEEVVYPHEVPRPENVVLHPKRSQMDLPIQDVLRAAHRADLAECVIVGRTKDGQEYFASSIVDTARVIFWLTRGAHVFNMLIDEVTMGAEEDDPDKTA